MSTKAIPNLAVIFTAANAVGPVTMISGGYINDRIGPKWALLIGGLLFGGGMIGSGMAKTFAALFLSYGLGVGLGVGLVYGTVVSNTIKFFPDYRGLAGGLTTAAYGGSSILIPPVAAWLMEHFSVAKAFQILGAIMLAVICMSAFIITPCPKEFKPESTLLKKGVGQSGKKDKNYRQMLADPLFYVLLLILLCGAFSGLMIISQASPMARKIIGMTARSGAAVVSILALFNTAGRMIAGALSDKIGVPNTLRAAFAASFAALLMLHCCRMGDTVLFTVCIGIIGFCFGAIMGIYPGFTAMEFGTKNNSVNYGIMFIGFALAGAVGPGIMGFLYNVTGKYQPAFLVSAALNMAGLGLIELYKKMSH